MKRKPKPSTTAAAELRRRAEARLREPQTDQRPKVTGQKSAADPQRMVHELQVHQVELEMQNAELQEARDRMEALLEKYVDLYDFAPVGYFSLDDQSLIQEVNLTGAALLGVDRSRLIHQRLQGFIAPTSRPAFQAFLQNVFAKPGKKICEVSLLHQNGSLFLADLQAVPAESPQLNQRWCRVAVSDITALKQAEEVQRRTEVLTAANQELEKEIVRRQAVEEALEKSEQHQFELLEESRQMQEQLRQLSHQMLHAQEEERKRISRELHDEIAQTLVGIDVQLENLTREETVDPKSLKRKITRTQRIVEKSVNIVHRFARELRPTLLDDLGLIAALHSLMKDFTKRTGIRVRFNTFSGVEQLNSNRRTVLYRVAQSALANVAQHAQASRVEVSLKQLPNAVSMEIKDDGKSFEVERVLQAKDNKHLGLVGMRERMEMVGGSFAVESVSGLGTTIRAQIPFN